MTPPSLWSRLHEIGWLFFKLGVFGFGGPAAHIALMQEEFVEKRKWLDRQHFLDLMGATNLIPGPNSTQMTMHVGYERAGIPGLLVAGFSFILPAAALTALLAWMYVTYGSLPQVKPILDGMQPAILALIAATLWKLAKTAVQSRLLAILGLLVMLVALTGLQAILALGAGTIFGGALLLFLRRDEEQEDSSGEEKGGKKGGGIAGGALWFFTQCREVQASLLVWGSGGSALPRLAPVASLAGIGWFFLKIGLVLYGSGYVLIAFLEQGLVHELKWLSSEQLFHAVAMGQMTPGPVLTTATAVGWLLKGWSGAVLATVAMFLPSFVLVALLNPIVPKLRRSRWMSAFLDSVNVSAVGLMAAVTLKLGWVAMGHWTSWVIGALAVGLRIRFKLHAIWLIIGGGTLGYLAYLLFG